MPQNSIVIRSETKQPVAEQFSDDIAIHAALNREKRITLLVKFADDTNLPGHSAERFFDLTFDKPALFLDDNDFFQPTSEIADLLGVNRIDQTQAEHPHAV